MKNNITNIMSTYIEFKDNIAFHPGYYIKEVIEQRGLTQEDFAKRLDTTPKNLSLLIRGEQSLSIDIAMKLSRLLGTSVSYWLNLQNAYDTIIAEQKSEVELKAERKVFEILDYQYFCENYGLSENVQDIDEQIKGVRQLLQVATLSVFMKPDMTASFREQNGDISLESMVKANTLVQLGINQTLMIEAPRYNRSCFERVATYASSLVEQKAMDLKLLKESFRDAGVVLVSIPDIAGSNLGGATKKVGNNIMLLFNGEKNLFQEIEHILNGDYGITLIEE